MVADKTWHALIARKVKRINRPRPLRSIQREVIRTRPEPLPRLERPKQGVYPMPAALPKHYNIIVRWTPKDWWRFKRACYAQGKTAASMLRAYMQGVIEQYERMQP